MAVEYLDKPMRVNYFRDVLPKGALMHFEKKKITLYSGIPGKNQRVEAFKYADMEGVYPVNIMGFSPTGIVIAMKDGSTHKFAVTGRKNLLPWLQERIEACQPHTKRPSSADIEAAADGASEAEG